jgi:hypothetical protein
MKLILRELWMAVTGPIIVSLITTPVAWIHRCESHETQDGGSGSRIVSELYIFGYRILQIQRGRPV